jgi:N-ethylmaleimide reductase
MLTHAQNKLFTPVQIGPITLKHRIVMPPMSRLRAHWPSGVPSDLMIEYYCQRASDGGLIFTEATAISPSGRSYTGAPGLYSDEQVTGWKRVTDAVHAKGSYMFAQLWHAGRAFDGRGYTDYPPYDVRKLEDVVRRAAASSRPTAFQE